MGKGKKLLVLLLVVLLLVGGYFAASHFLKDDADEETGSEPAETVAVDAMKADDVTGVMYVCGDETIELEKEDDVWYLKSDHDFPLNQAYADTMAGDAANLQALRLVSESADDLAEYGLDAPETAYVFALSDGTQVTYYIGNYNSFGGTYYMNVAGTEKIYLIEAGLLDDFGHDLSDLADVEDMASVPTEDLHGMTMTLDGKTTRLFYKSDGLKTVYSDSFTWFFDEKTQADALGAQDLIGTAADFKSSGCADYKAEKDELAAYGLDEPALTTKFEYTVSEEKETGEKDENDEPVTETVTHEETLTLFVGKASKDGSLYAKTDRSDVVYLIGADYLKTLRDYDYTKLRDVQLCAVQTSDIESMDVKIGGKTSKITITRAKTDSDSDTIDYKLDGAMITPVKFNDFYTAIQSVKAEGFADKTVAMDDAPITVTYHTTRKGFETMTLRLAPYDQNFYVADLNGVYGTLINKRDAQKITQTFETIGEK